jgi:hypothetical protein
MTNIFARIGTAFGAWDSAHRVHGVWVPPRAQVWANTGMSLAALGLSIAAFAMALVALLGMHHP